MFKGEKRNRALTSSVTRLSSVGAIVEFFSKVVRWLAFREQELTATPAYKRRLSAFSEWLEGE